MEQRKTLHELQMDVDQYISQFKEGYFEPMEMLARLTEELGELSREVQHVYGTKKKKETEAERNLKEELGDLLFVLVCFANSQKIELDEALTTVIEKFNTRDRDRWTRKED